MPNSSGAVDLNSLSEEEREQVNRLAEERNGPGNPEPEDNRQKVLTAFLVLVAFDGNPTILRINDPNLDIHSDPSPDLVFGAASTIVKDMNAQEAAQGAAALTVQAMMEQSRAIVEQQQQAAIAANIDLSKLRNRG